MREFDRRNCVIGAASMLSAFPGTAYAECRRPENPSVASCSSGCTGLWDTFDCQLGVVFPGQNRVLRGAVAGAVLGGVIAFATGDVSVVQGVLLGGVVGGLAASAQTYMGYRLARSGGNARNAFQEMEYDKHGDEDRLGRVVLADAAMNLFQQVEDMTRESGASGALDEIQPLQRPPSMFREFIRETAMPLIRHVAQGQTGSGSTREVSQISLRRVGAQIGSAAPPPNFELVERDRLTAEVAGGTMANLRRLARRINADDLLTG